MGPQIAGAVVIGFVLSQVLDFDFFTKSPSDNLLHSSNSETSPYLVQETHTSEEIEANLALLPEGSTATPWDGNDPYPAAIAQAKANRTLERVWTSPNNQESDTLAVWAEGTSTGGNISIVGQTVYTEPSHLKYSFFVGNSEGTVFGVKGPNARGTKTLLGPDGVEHRYVEQFSTESAAISSIEWAERERTSTGPIENNLLVLSDEEPVEVIDVELTPSNIPSLALGGSTGVTTAPELNEGSEAVGGGPIINETFPEQEQAPARIETSTSYSVVGLPTIGHRIGVF